MEQSQNKLKVLDLVNLEEHLYNNFEVLEPSEIPNNNDRDSSQVKHRIKLDYGWKTFLRGMR